MRNLVVFFGGKSVEHDVSIITGLQVIQNTNPANYRVIPIYWTQENKLLPTMQGDNPKTLIQNILKRGIKADLGIGNRALILKPERLFAGEKRIPIDIAFPCFHGTHGEDGSFQGLLELMGVPYVGSGVLASALGMNKRVFKDLMQRHDIPVLEGYRILASARRGTIRIPFRYPVIVKPTNLGSSIGVKKAHTWDEVEEALDVIFHLDTEALVEPFLERMTEINCAVLGSAIGAETSLCEEPISAQEVLSFEDKYLHGGKKMKSHGMASSDRNIPALITKEQTAAVQRLAKEVFTICGCAGVARVDCMVDKHAGKIYVNEINTIPGSLAYYLWEASGVSFRELIDKLVAIADEEYRQKSALLRTFESAVLKNFFKG